MHHPLSQVVFLHASINFHMLNTFKHLLKESSVYDFSIYDETRSNPNFTYDDAPNAILFTEQTLFVDLEETTHPILMESSRYRNYELLMSLAYTKTICQVRFSF